MQSYVRTGRFERLARFETSLAYLALAHARLGNDTEAREAVLRLATAERIEPTWSRLQLGADGRELEALADRLVPDLMLGKSTRIATATPVPPGRPAVPSPEPDRMRLVEQMVAQECARIQREADAKIAAIQLDAAERIAAERVAAREEAEERIAAAERAAEVRIAELQRAADQRVAVAESAARRASEEQRVAVSREPVPRPVPTPAPPTRVSLPDPRSRAEWVALLRRGDEAAAAGRLAEAAEVYARVARSNEAREIRIAAAVGLYRISAYPGAAEAFHSLAPFTRGEEDLRYYNAVSLYETGRYADARHELSCALPFIERTEDVNRYRTKIEQMVALQSRRPLASLSK